MRVRAEKKGLHLTVTRTSEVPRYIKTDESKLRQVLVNLLSNAVKFTEEGSVTLNIENCQLNIENWGGEEGNRQSSIVNRQFSIRTLASALLRTRATPFLTPSDEHNTARRPKRALAWDWRSAASLCN